jgi:hypothetical protein
VHFIRCSLVTTIYIDLSRLPVIGRVDFRSTGTSSIRKQVNLTVIRTSHDLSERYVGNLVDKSKQITKTLMPYWYIPPSF